MESVTITSNCVRQDHSALPIQGTLVLPELALVTQCEFCIIVFIYPGDATVCFLGECATLLGYGIVPQGSGIHDVALFREAGRARFSHVYSPQASPHSFHRRGEVKSGQT